MLSRFHLIPEHYGQTDGRTDGQICYINIARLYADARQQRIPITFQRNIESPNVRAYGHYDLARIRPQ